MSVTKKLLDKLLKKSYRDAYVEENVRTGVAYQIRALREARGWSQKKFAELLGKPQSVLSRIEDPDYGKLSIQTLLQVASAFDVALMVQFTDYPEFVARMANVTPAVLNKASFSEGQFSATESVWARPLQVDVHVYGVGGTGGADISYFSYQSEAAHESSPAGVSWPSYDLGSATEPKHSETRALGQSGPVGAIC